MLVLQFMPLLNLIRVYLANYQVESSLHQLLLRLDHSTNQGVHYLAWIIQELPNFPLKYTLQPLALLVFLQLALQLVLLVAQPNLVQYL